MSDDLSFLCSTYVFTPFRPYASCFSSTLALFLSLRLHHYFFGLFGFVVIIFRTRTLLACLFVFIHVSERGEIYTQPTKREQMRMWLETRCAAHAPPRLPITPLLVFMVMSIFTPARANDDIDTHLLAILLPTILGVFVLLGIILGLAVWCQRKRSRRRTARRLELGISGYAEADELAMEPGAETGAGRSRNGTPHSHSTPSALRHPHSAPPVDEMTLEAQHPHADNDLRAREGSAAAEGDGTGHSSRTHSPTPLTGVAIENRVRPRSRLPKGTVLVEQEDLQYRIDFSRLHDIPEAAPPPLPREERKRLEEEKNRVASPLFYGRAEYLHDGPLGTSSGGGSVRGLGSYAGSYAGSRDGRASVDVFRRTANASPYRPQDFSNDTSHNGSRDKGSDEKYSFAAQRAEQAALFFRQGSANSIGSLANASFGEPRRGAPARSRDPNFQARRGEFLSSTSDDFDGMENDEKVRHALRQRQKAEGSAPASGWGEKPPQALLARDAHHHHHSTRDEDGYPLASSIVTPPALDLQTRTKNAKPRDDEAVGAAQERSHKSPPPLQSVVDSRLSTAGSSSIDYFANTEGLPRPPSVDVLHAHVSPIVALPTTCASAAPGVEATTVAAAAQPTTAGQSKAGPYQANLE